MGQGAGSRVATGRFQAAGQTGYANLYGVPTVAVLPLHAPDARAARRRQNDVVAGDRHDEKEGPSRERLNQLMVAFTAAKVGLRGAPGSTASSSSRSRSRSATTAAPISQHTTDPRPTAH
jgi:hypothetical protein